MAGVRQPGKHEGHEKNADGEPNGGKRAKKRAAPSTAQRLKYRSRRPQVGRRIISVPHPARVVKQNSQVGSRVSPLGDGRGEISHSFRWPQLWRQSLRPRIRQHAAKADESQGRAAPRSGLALTFRLTLWQAPRVAPSQRPEGGQRARLSIVRNAHHR